MSTPAPTTQQEGAFLPNATTYEFYQDVGTYIRLRYERELADYRRGIPASHLAMPRFPGIGERMAGELDSVASMLVKAYCNRGWLLIPFFYYEY